MNLVAHPPALSTRAGSVEARKANVAKSVETATSGNREVAMMATLSAEMVAQVTASSRTDGNATELMLATTKEINARKSVETALTLARINAMTATRKTEMGKFLAKNSMIYK